jgi:hypothetical protein
MSDQSWYLARLLMKCSAKVDNEPLFSEEFVLLRGGSYDEVYEKAETKGRKMAHSYLNDEGHEVRWTFQSVLEIRRVIDDELIDGSELFARTCSTPPDVVPKGPLDE